MGRLNSPERSDGSPLADEPEASFDARSRALAGRFWRSLLAASALAALYYRSFATGPPAVRGSGVLYSEAAATAVMGALVVLALLTALFLSRAITSVLNEAARSPSAE